MHLCKAGLLQGSVSKSQKQHLYNVFYWYTSCRKCLKRNGLFLKFSRNISVYAYLYGFVRSASLRRCGGIDHSSIRRYTVFYFFLNYAYSVRTWTRVSIHCQSSLARWLSPTPIWRPKFIGRKSASSLNHSRVLFGPLHPVRSSQSVMSSAQQPQLHDDGSWPKSVPHVQRNSFPTFVIYHVTGDSWTQGQMT